MWHCCIAAGLLKENLPRLSHSLAADRLGEGSSCGLSGWMRTPGSGSLTRSSGCAPCLSHNKSCRSGEETNASSVLSLTGLTAQEKKQKLDAEATAKTAKRRAKRLKQKARPLCEACLSASGLQPLATCLSRHIRVCQFVRRTLGPSLHPGDKVEPLSQVAPCLSARRSKRAMCTGEEAVEGGANRWGGGQHAAGRGRARQQEL